MSSREVLALFSYAPKSLRKDIQNLLQSTKESYTQKLKERFGLDIIKTADEL